MTAKGISMINRRAMVMLAMPLFLGACQDFITDFKQQPSVGTWQKFSADSLKGETQPFRANPQGSVPTTGITLASWQVSYAAMPGTLDSMSTLENPVPADERSLMNGRKQYQINCSVCHGIAGDVNTPLKQVNMVMGSVVPTLVAGTALTRTDGYLWGIIRNGRGLMQPYNHIPEMDRWDVVNYTRGLQGRYPVEKSAAGFPGQTGTALPGYSAVGPTVPASYAKPSVNGMVPKAEKPRDASKTGGH